MAQDPNAVGAPATTPYCGTNGAVKYFGYFDCALSTPYIVGATVVRRGCVQTGDLRAATIPANYRVPPCGTDTGMVWDPSANPNDLDADIGSQALGYTIYVMSPHVVQVQDHTVYGTIAVEGEGTSGCGGGQADVKMKTRGEDLDRPELECHHGLDDAAPVWVPAGAAGLRSAPS